MARRLKLYVDIPAERQLAAHASIGTDGFATVRTMIGPDDFTDPRLGAVWRAACALADTSTPIDVVTVQRQTAIDGRATVSLDYVLALSDVLTGDAILTHHAGKLAAASAARRTMASLHALMAKAESADPIDWMQDAAAWRVDGIASQTELVAVGEVSRRAWQSIHAAKPPAVMTGIPFLDRLTGGLANAMHVIAARPGQGKTSLATQIAVSVARQEQAKPQPGAVLFFCVEMPNEDQMLRMASQQSSVPYAAIRYNRLTASQDAEIGDTLADLSTLPLHMGDQGALSVQRIVAETLRRAQSGRVALVVVDYYQRIRWAGQRMDRRLDELVEVSTGLADLALRARCPVITLAQLNRAVESEKRRPRMADLSDCSQLEKDAHTIIFPFLPEKIGLSDDKGEAQIIVGKNRSGETGASRDGEVRWIGAHVRFDGGA